MAIDTAEKRKSIAHIGLRFIGPGVTPNITHDQEWRQESGYGYAGIPADEPTASAAPVNSLILLGVGR